jgi:hypothetical protein
MDEKVTTVFQVDSPIINEARVLDNYLIVHDEIEKDNLKTCAVYFSSNYIYFPNSEESVKKDIFEKNRYEWWNLRYPKASKHIFIRDVYKQWYLHGINTKLNSLEKLAEFLKEATKGYDCIFIGSSAGGYAAVLLGSMLRVNKIYAFNNQFFLTDLLEKSNGTIDPLIFREANNPAISKFYNIKPYIKDPTSIFYFHSNKSEWDVRQLKEVIDLKINTISVKTNVHGIPFLKNNLVPLFNFSERKLKMLIGKELSPILFSIKIVGLWKSFGFIISIIPQIYKRMILIPIKNKFR